MDFLKEKLYETKLLFHLMWLSFDNDVDNDQGFAIYSLSGEPVVSSNFIATGMSKANGSSEITSITRDQLKAVRETFRHFSHEGLLADYVTRLEKSETRVSRAFYQIQMARCSKDIAIKVFSYCSAIETLFSSSSSGELAHQLAERLACFLEPRGGARIEIYKQFKKAYGFRSRFSHGGSFAATDLPKLVILSVACDDYLRRSLVKLLNDRELATTFESMERLDDFFLSHILGEAGFPTPD